MQQKLSVSNIDPASLQNISFQLSTFENCWQFYKI